MNSSLGLSILIGVLQTIFVILLWVLVIVLILALLLLFVPIRYEASGTIDDPEGHDNTDCYNEEFLHQNVKGQVRFSWLLHLISGGISWPEQPVFIIRILFWKINVTEQIRKSRRKKAQKKAGGRSGRQEQSPKPSLNDKIKGIWKKFPEYRQYLSQKSTKDALHSVIRTGTGTIGRILPDRWSISGTAGFGDPELTGAFLELEGFLIPLTGEHLWILPEYMRYQADLTGEARGKIRLITIAAAAWKLLINKNVRVLVRFFRNAGQGSNEEGGTEWPEEKTAAVRTQEAEA